MAKTYCGDVLELPFRHKVKTGHGDYIISGSWIDTASPSDMMDYDFTDTLAGLRAAHAETHRIWCAMQVKS